MICRHSRLLALLVCASCLSTSVVAGQGAGRDTTTAPADTNQRRGPLMLEVSVGRTKMPGFTTGGGPATIAGGIGTGKWFGDRVMVGLEARAHGTVDIEESVPSVRYVSGVVAARWASGEPVFRLGVGPAWVVNPGARAVRTTGYSASVELPFQPDLRDGSLVVFLRYSATGRVSTPPSRSVPFRTRQIALGLRVEL